MITFLFQESRARSAPREIYSRHFASYSECTARKQKRRETLNSRGRMNAKRICAQITIGENKRNENAGAMAVKPAPRLSNDDHFYVTAIIRPFFITTKINTKTRGFRHEIAPRTARDPRAV